MASDWSREDFFHLTSTDIHKLKLQLAQKCDIHYGVCNQEKDMGFTSNGVMGLKAAALMDRVKAVQETMGDNTLSAQHKSSKLLDEHTFATVISGCHVKWATTTVLNTGYIMEAGAKMVASWDSSVERRAGGFDAKTTPSAQEFTLSNMSSLMALLMEVVYHYKHQSLTPQLINAFRTIRITLYLGADADEISALNAAENVSQSKRKTHSELDNIKMVSSWMQSMQQYAKLSKDSALDVYKYAIAVRDPRFPLPDWLETLLGGESSAMSARVAALANNIKLGDLQTWKAETTFEMMSSYAMVNQRVRFLKGFDETALAYLNTQLFSVMGENGIAHRKFPLGHAILMSPDMLLSSAFSRAKDIGQVLAWLIAERLAWR